MRSRPAARIDHGAHTRAPVVERLSQSFGCASLDKRIRQTIGAIVLQKVTGIADTEKAAACGPNFASETRAWRLCEARYPTQRRHNRSQSSAPLFLTRLRSVIGNMRVLSGIQPTGRPHWGNYFGAIRQYIDLQEANEGYYFIADLHALTTVRDADTMRQSTLDAAIDLLALGLDPSKATLFVQSHVPEVSELCWLLLSGTPMGLLQRCVAYKEKVDKGLPADAGLFTYPVLQAADILAYDSQLVPVGADQVQHIEVCRDIAAKFNHQFGETFLLPKAQTLDHSAKVPGTDGEKMSKSYDNTLPLFGEVKKIRKQIMRITTDSRPMEDPKEPENDHLFQLFRLFADDQATEEMAAMYRRGGFGYGEVKKAVAEASENYFQAARERRDDLENNLDHVHDVLRCGAEKARSVAAAVLSRAQSACGLR